MYIPIMIYKEQGKRIDSITVGSQAYQLERRLAMNQDAYFERKTDHTKKKFY